jgi:hypothetical protein
MLSECLENKALYESVWVTLAKGPKMQDALQIKDLSKFDRKTGELWLEDAGFARFIRAGRSWLQGKRDATAPARLACRSETRFLRVRRPTRIHLEAKTRINNEIRSNSDCLSTRE